MKLWLSIFSAIIAAAVVIWGAMAWSAGQAREKVERLASLETNIRIAAQFAELVAMNDGVYEEKRMRDTQLQVLNDFAKSLAKLPDQTDRNRLKSEYRRAAYMAIDFVQVKASTEPRNKGIKDTLEWVNELERQLNQVLPP